MLRCVEPVDDEMVGDVELESLEFLVVNGVLQAVALVQEVGRLRRAAAASEEQTDDQ